MSGPASITLSPCPFCGGEAEIQRYGNGRQSTQYACTMCGCFLETGEEWGHGRRWNERTALAAPARAAPAVPVERVLALAKEWRKTAGDWMAGLSPPGLPEHSGDLILRERIKRLNECAAALEALASSEENGDG